MLLIFFKIKSLQPVVTLRPLFVFGLIPFDLSVAIGEGSALRSGGCALEQQQRIVGHSVKIEIGPSICRLAIDFLPITAVPEGEQVFVSGIEIITVASPEVDDLGDVDGTAEVETYPDVVYSPCAEKSQRIVVIDSRSEVHLVLGVYFPSAADQICFEPPARTVVKDQLGHVAPSLVGGAQAPIPIGPIRLYGLVAGQRKAVARKLRDVDRAMKIGGVGGLDETSGDFFPVLIYEFINGVFACEPDRSVARRIETKRIHPAPIIEIKGATDRLKPVSVVLHGHITDVPTQFFEMRGRSAAAFATGYGDPFLIVEGRNIDIVADVDIVEERDVEIVGAHVFVADIPKKDVLKRRGNRLFAEKPFGQFGIRAVGHAVDLREGTVEVGIRFDVEGGELLATVAHVEYCQPVVAVLAVGPLRCEVDRYGDSFASHRQQGASARFHAGAEREGTQCRRPEDRIGGELFGVAEEIAAQRTVGFQCRHAGVVTIFLALLFITVDVASAQFFQSGSPIGHRLLFDAFIGEDVFAELVEIEVCRPFAVLPEIERLFDIANQVFGRHRPQVEIQPKPRFVAIVKLRHAALEGLLVFKVRNQRIDGVVVAFDRSIVGFVQRHVADQIHRSPKFQTVGLVVFVVFDHLFELLTVFSGGGERSPEFFLVAVAGGE